MWSIYGSCRALWRRVPVPYRALWRRIPALLRSLHLWESSGKSLDLAELISSCEEERVTHLSAGVGFCVAYAPLRSPQLWLVGTDSFLLSSTNPQSLQLPASAGTVKQVACGLAHGIVLATTGEVFSFSVNGCGMSPHESLPVMQLLLAPRLPCAMSKVVSGLNHYLFLGKDSSVYACGWSTDGQTGVGHYESVSQLTQVSLNNEEVSSVHTCADTSFALTAGGRMYGWGNNEYGQLGVHLREKQVCVPVAVDCSCLDGQVVSMATGGAFTAVLTSAGSVYYTGYGIKETMSDLDLTHLSQFRRLHIDGRVISLQAGLHYLVIQTEKLAAANEMMLLGKYPSGGGDCKPDTRRERIVRLPKRAHSLVCGPDQLIALLDC